MKSPLSSALLQNRIEKIYDHLYANGRTRTPAGICREVGKILHVGMFLEDVRCTTPAFSFSPGELKELYRGDGAFSHMVALRIRADFTEMNKAWSLYADDPRIDLDDFDIGFVAGQLHGIRVADRDRDVFGDALEIFRAQWSKRAGGQFFTDARVTSLAMTLLEFDPRRGDDLVDLCAGTGGFLLAGLNHIRRTLENENRTDIEQSALTLARESLRGQEADQELTDIANATLSSRVGQTKNFVLRGDSLRPESFKAGLGFDRHLCAASNPPFGTKITVKEPGVLRQFDLARTDASVSSSKLSSRAPDILFVEQNIRILKPGVGRVAIVLPYQILSGPQTLFVREWLLRHAEILAVVDLPAETFQPHTGTKTALVLLRRRAKPLSSIEALKSDRSKIFMALPRWIGHDRRGAPVFRRLADGSITDDVLTDFSDVETAWAHFRRGKNPAEKHPACFVTEMRAVANDELLRFNALFHRPPADSVLSTVSRGKRKALKPNSVQLADVVERIFYPTRFKRHYVEEGPDTIPFLGGANITELLVTGKKWLRYDDPKLDDLRVRAGWILITRSGSTGIVSTVPLAWDGWAMSEHVIRIVPDANKLDPWFLQAFLRTKLGQEQLARGVFGSVIDEITPEHVGSLLVPLPEKSDLLDITLRFKEAEEARQRSIESATTALQRLNELYGTSQALA